MIQTSEGLFWSTALQPFDSTDCIHRDLGSNHSISNPYFSI